MVDSTRQGEDTASGHPMFQVDHVSLEYPAGPGQAAVPILTDVSFEVDRGASLTPVGPSVLENRLFSAA